MPDGIERRVDDKRIIEMHGDIKTLLERSKNTTGFLKSVDDTVSGHTDDISKINQEISGVKTRINTIGGFLTVAWTGLLGAFLKRG